MAVTWFCRVLAGILMLYAPTAIAVTDVNQRKTFVITRAESPIRIRPTTMCERWIIRTF